MIYGKKCMDWDWHLSAASKEISLELYWITLHTSIMEPSFQFALLQYLKALTQMVTVKIDCVISCLNFISSFSADGKHPGVTVCDPGHVSRQNRFRGNRTNNGHVQCPHVYLNSLIPLSSDISCIDVNDLRIVIIWQWEQLLDLIVIPLRINEQEHPSRISPEICFNPSIHITHSVSYWYCLCLDE